MILEVGLGMASQLGLDAASIGVLAKATRMSKSGLFAHYFLARAQKSSNGGGNRRDKECGHWCQSACDIWKQRAR